MRREGKWLGRGRSLEAAFEGAADGGVVGACVVSGAVLW